MPNLNTPGITTKKTLPANAYLSNQECKEAFQRKLPCSWHTPKMRARSMNSALTESH